MDMGREFPSLCTVKALLTRLPMFVSAIGGLKLVEDEEDDRVGKAMWIIL